MKNRFLIYRIVFIVLITILTAIFGMLGKRAWTIENTLFVLAFFILSVWLSGFLQKKVRTKWEPVWSTQKPELYEKEDILVEGPAKYIGQGNSIGGKLYLTNHRLLFTSHDYQADYKLEGINSINTSYSILGIFKEKLSISVNGKQEDYHVMYPGDWKKIVLKQQEINKY